MRNDSVQERLAQLEGELRGRLYGSAQCTSPINDAIHRHTMLVAREVHAACLAYLSIGGVVGTNGPHEYRRRLAAELYPLSPKRVLREEPDPVVAHMRWRVSNGVMQWLAQDGRWWSVKVNYPGLPPTAERIDLWASLKAEPYRDVPDDGEGE